MTENKEAETPNEAAELEAAEQVEEAVEQKEAASVPGLKKGLMQRRKSFAQGSVPNAHRGYNPKTPVVMLGIILVMFIASFILAAIAG